VRAIFVILIFLSILNANDKLILVFTHMKYCSWCKKMKKETIDNKKAQKKIKKHFILTQIQRESGNLPSFLNPELFPTTYILSSDGNKILDEIDGYMKKDEFIYHINTIYELEKESKKLSK